MLTLGRSSFPGQALHVPYCAAIEIHRSDHHKIAVFAQDALGIAMFAGLPDGSADVVSLGCGDIVFGRSVGRKGIAKKWRSAPVAAYHARICGEYGFGDGTQ